MDGVESSLRKVKLCDVWNALIQKGSSHQKCIASMSNEQWTNQMKLITNYTEWERMAESKRKGRLFFKTSQYRQRQSSPIKRVLSFNVRLWLWVRHTHTPSKGNRVSSVHDFTRNSSRMIIMKLPLSDSNNESLINLFSHRREGTANNKNNNNHKEKRNKQSIVA